jgi:hypothetical protein
MTIPTVTTTRLTLRPFIKKDTDPSPGYSAIKLGMTLIEQAQYFGIGCYRYTIERSVWESPRR